MRIQMNKVAKTFVPAKSAPTIGPRFDYIAYYCDHCGAEIYGAWKYVGAYADAYSTISDAEYKTLKPIFAAVKEEQTYMRNLYACPNCGRDLSGQPGYYADAGNYENYEIKNYIHKHFENESDLFEMMKNIRDEGERNTMLELAYKVAAECNVPIQANISPEKVAEITSSSESLQEHIKILLSLESGVYSVSYRLADLYKQKKDIERQIRSEVAAVKSVSDPEEEKAKKELKKYKQELDAMVASTPQIPKMPQAPSEPEYAVPNFFNKKKVEAKNQMLRYNYDNMVTEYKQKLEKYNDSLKKKRAHEAEISALNFKIEQATNELNNIKKEAKERKHAAKEKAIAESSYLSNIIFNRINQEIEDTIVRMQQLYRCRNELYSYDVIFGKYRNPVALATMYEYLVSGRCDGLSGAQGAYNLYESECRANLIISQLDGVLNSLEEIKNTQYMIYSSIQMANASLIQLNQTASKAAESIRRMGGSLEQLTHNSELMAHNSAVSAYYAQLDAELSHANGYLKARLP